MEQFRKFSTGSSYPAILDSDVEKTLIAVPDLEEQNNIVKRLMVSLRERNRIIKRYNEKWEWIQSMTIDQIKTKSFDFADVQENSSELVFSSEQISERLNLFYSPEESVELGKINED